MTDVWAEVADADATALLAVTTTRAVEPALEDGSAKEAAVAPATGEQALPDESHSFHW
jgi:hypothetical protein